MDANAPDRFPAPGQRRSWARFVLAAVIVVVLTAGATATAGLLNVQSFVDDLKAGGTIAGAEDVITRAEAGEPQTLLLIGSDHRYGTGVGDARSDTMMLVRIDPDAPATTVLSIPRDLRISFSWRGATYGPAKLNETYTVGGEALTARVISRLLRNPHQPHSQRRVQRLPRGDRHDRLRLRRRRPALLPQKRPRHRAVRRDRHRARLSADVRRESARLRPLPPPRQRPRARRAPAGLPAPGALAVRRRAVHRRPARADERDRRADAHRRRPAVGLLAAEAAETGRLLGQKTDPAGRAAADRLHRARAGSSTSRRATPTSPACARSCSTPRRRRLLRERSDGAEAAAARREPRPRRRRRASASTTWPRPASSTRSRSAPSPSPSTTRDTCRRPAATCPTTAAPRAATRSPTGRRRRTAS